MKHNNEDRVNKKANNINRSSCDFSPGERVCKTMDEAGVPVDSKWRTLILYMRGLKDFNYLTDEQKAAIQAMLVKIIGSRDYSDDKFNEVINKKEAILSDPYKKKIKEAFDESSLLLKEFQHIARDRQGDLKKLEDDTVSCLKSGDDPKKMISNIRDAFHDVIKVMQEDAARLEELSSTDGLTRLRNRRSFDEFLSEHIEKATQSKKPLSLLLMDIDHFKKFNDTYGHRVGDQALITVAKIIGNLINDFQKQDSGSAEYLAARYGGEEFAVVMSGKSLEEAVPMAETIREHISNYNFVIRDNMGQIVQKNIQITVSIGACELQRDWNDSLVEHLIECADKGLYEAKDKGRNCVCPHS